METLFHYSNKSNQGGYKKNPRILTLPQLKGVDKVCEVGHLQPSELTRTRTPVTHRLRRIKVID